MTAQLPEIIESAWANLKSAHDDLDTCKQKLERVELEIEKVLDVSKLGGVHESA